MIHRVELSVLSSVVIGLLFGVIGGICAFMLVRRLG